MKSMNRFIWLLSVLITIVNGRNPIKIQYWTKVFGREDWGFQDHLKSCPALIGTCEYANYTSSSLSSADVLLWHMRDDIRLPTYRPSYQKWAFTLMESQAYSGLTPAIINYEFNLTITFKSDADVIWNYGLCKPLEKRVKMRPISKKSRLIAWFTSNCYPQSQRQVYAHALKSYIDIDIYGSCNFATHNCPKNIASECFDKLNTTYRFTLAFENSLCVDYVTEKVFYLMRRHIDVIPIVIGKVDYSDILPPHSFIDVREYKSPRELAAYLRLLSEDEQLYNSYFKWRETYTCDVIIPPIGCRVCSYLSRTRDQHTFANIDKHFSFENNCDNPSEFYSMWEELISSYNSDNSYFNSLYVYGFLCIVISFCIYNLFWKRMLRYMPSFI